MNSRHTTPEDPWPSHDRPADRSDAPCEPVRQPGTHAGRLGRLVEAAVGAVVEYYHEAFERGARYATPHEVPGADQSSASIVPNVQESHKDQFLS
jgi:hypothetical protein